jgi:hypothetical protein
VVDPLSAPGAKEDWSLMLDRIEAAVARALVETAAQERVLDATAPPITPADSGIVNERLGGLRARLCAAGRLAEAIEALLAADEEEVRTWTGMAGRIRPRLESVPSSGI